MTTVEAIAAAKRPRRFGAWYVAEHRLRMMRAYGQTILATSLGSPLLYLFALGVGLATLVDRSNQVDGVSYLVFVAPALLASAAVTVASEEATYPVMSNFKWNPVFFGMNAAPLSAGQIASGVLIAIVIRIVVTVAIFFLVMGAFGAVPLASGWWAIAAGCLTGLAVAAAIAAYASSVRDDKGQMAFVQRFVITPMLLFSGTFFPLTELPIYLQWVGWISPLWHGTELARLATYGAAMPTWLAVVHVLYLVAVAIVSTVAFRRIVARRLS